MMSYPQAEQSVGLLLMKNSVLMTINDALYYALTLANGICWNGYTNICVSHAKPRLCFSGVKLILRKEERNVFQFTKLTQKLTMHVLKHVHTTLYMVYRPQLLCSRCLQTTSLA